MLPPINKDKTQEIFKNYTATHERGHSHTSSGHWQNVSATAIGDSCRSLHLLHLQDSGEYVPLTGTSVGCHGASPSLRSRRATEAPEELCLAPSPQPRKQGQKGHVRWPDGAGRSVRKEMCFRNSRWAARTVYPEEGGPREVLHWTIPTSIKDRLCFPGSF